jgi:hypothetical protein
MGLFSKDIASPSAFSSGALGQGETMADDKSKTGKSDRDRINVAESYEVRDWSKRLGVSEGELKAAVKAVGPMAKDVAKKLGKSL